jgi:alkylation response protein AidB-like acyl-CoA dehydrogenase
MSGVLVLRDLCEKEIAPHAADVDDNSRFPDEAWKALNAAVSPRCMCPRITAGRADRIIGEPGSGFKMALATLDHIAQVALDAAIAYTQERKQFNKRISDLEAIQFMLPDMAMKVEAARLMVYTAGARAECGEGEARLLRLVIQVLCFRRCDESHCRRRAVVWRLWLYH